MSWFRVDDRFPSHPKVEALEALGPERHAFAVAAWTLLGADCAGLDVGGVVTETRIRKVLSAWPEKKRARSIDDLCSVGLLDRGEETSFHDWESYRAPLKDDAVNDYERRRKSAWRARQAAKGLPFPSDVPDNVPDVVPTGVPDIASRTKLPNVPTLPSRPVPSRPLATLDRASAWPPTAHTVAGWVFSWWKSEHPSTAIYGLDGVRQAIDGHGIQNANMRKCASKVEEIAGWLKQYPDPETGKAHLRAMLAAWEADPWVSGEKAHEVATIDPDKYLRAAVAAGWRYEPNESA